MNVDDTQAGKDGRVSRPTCDSHAGRICGAATRHRERREKRCAGRRKQACPLKRNLDFNFRFPVTLIITAKRHHDQEPLQ